MPVTLRVEAEILPINCRIIDGQTYWYFYFRGLDSIRLTSTMVFETSIDELADIPQFFNNTALISKITFIYS